MAKMRISGAEPSTEDKQQKPKSVSNLDFYFSDNFGFGHHSEYHSYMYMHIRT
jgi:hypothetical protein